MGGVKKTNNRLCRAGAGLDSDSEEELSEGEELRRAVAAAASTSRAKRTPAKAAAPEVIILDSDSDDEAVVPVSPAPPPPQVGAPALPDILVSESVCWVHRACIPAGSRLSIGPRWIKVGETWTFNGTCCPWMLPPQPSTSAAL